MKFRLSYRFMLWFAALGLVLVFGIATISRYSFDAELRDYVHRKEAASLLALSDDLAEQYLQGNSWRFLPNNEHSWHRWVMHSLLNEAAEDVRRADERAREYKKHRWHKLRQELELMIGRLQLVDASGQLLIGPPILGDSHALTQSIIVQGKKVGELVLLPPRPFKEGHERQFQKAHFKNLSLIVSGTLVVALIFAWWVSRSMSRPIEKLAAHVTRLRNGNFDLADELSRSDEIGQLAKDLNGLAKTLAANETFRRHAMADVSHELRTPLALLRTRIEAMQDGVVPADENSLHALHGHVMRLSLLVDDLYQMSVADAQGLQLSMETIDISRTLKDVLDEAQSLLAEKELTLNIELQEGAFIQADERRIRQVFYNLISNSMRYTDAPGHLYVSVSRVEKTIRICFEDSAPGVSDEDLTQLCDRFFRVERSRSRESGGAGLGLSVVKTLVEAQNGTLALAHSPHGGLRVCMEFPEVACQ